MANQREGEIIHQDRPFIPSVLHEVFPEERANLENYVAGLRANIKTSLLKASGSLILTLFVKKRFAGDTISERLLNILQTRDRKTCIPWFMCCCAVNNINNVIRRLVGEEIRSTHDACSVSLSQKSGVSILNTNLERNRRIYILWVVKLLLASTQNPPNLRHVTFSCLNNVNPYGFWSKYIESVIVEEVTNEARHVLNNDTHILCTHTELGNHVCRAFFHIRDFVEINLNINNDNEDEDDHAENEIHLGGHANGIHHVATFGLGPSVIRSQKLQLRPGNHIMTEIEVISGLESVLYSYRVLCRNFFTYVAAGIHVDPAGPPAPDILSLDAIRNGLIVYFYVGISTYEGIGPHNFRFTSTNFGKCIAAEDLNCFWIVRNTLFTSYALAEKHEVLMQLMFRRIAVCNPELVNLRPCNLRLEVSALDRFSDLELSQLVQVLDDTSIPFVCDSTENLQIVPNYQVFGGPLELTKAEKYFDY